MSARIKTDRFGNPYQVIGCKDNRNGYPVGYAELGGKLYKVEPSESKNEKYSHWVKLTLVKKQRAGSM